MKIDAEFKLIVCILPRGKGTELVERLSLEMGISSANVSTGRGRGAGSIGNIGVWDEIDTLAIAVPTERADEIFSFIYHAAELDRPRGGIMYQHAVGPVTQFTMPDV